MSKRGADEYLTKDHGSLPNSITDRQASMATAAQLAGRKLKTPKSRLGQRANTPSGTSFLGVQPPTTTSQPPQQQPTFGAVGAGMTFGQAQSFPAGTNPPPSGGFTFQTPGSSSFTFGQNTSQPQTTFPNIFSKINGTDSSNQPNGASHTFGGFGASQGQTPAATQPEDTMMESPQKKQFSGSLFSGANGTGGQNGGFRFGQPAQTTNIPENTSTNPFGTQAQQPASGTLFGTSQAANTGFGSGSLFGQAPKPQESSQPSNLFASPQANDSTASNLFSFSKSASKPEEATQQSSLFSKPSPAEQDSQIKQSFSFGSSQAGSNTSIGFATQQASQLQPALSSFGENASSSQPPFNPFAQSVSGPASTSILSEATKEPLKFGVFSGFAEKPAASQAVAVEANQTETPKPAFSFGSVTSSTASNMFGLPSTSQSQTSKFLFGNPASQTALSSTMAHSDEPTKSAAKANTLSGFSFTPSAPVSNVSSGGLFSAQKLTSTEATPSIGGLFNRATELEKPATTTSVDGTGGQANSSAPFSSNTWQMPKSPASTEQGNPAKQSPKANKTINSTSGEPPLFGNRSSTITSQQFSNFAPTNFNLTEKEAPKTNSSIVQPSVPSSIPLFSSQVFSSQSSSPVKATDAATAGINAAAGQKEPATEYLRMRIRTNGPADTPDDLDNDESVAYSRHYRLHSLHRELQRRLAQLDPATQDFENVIIHYIATRERLGFLLGIRNAGTKRKGDDDDPRECASSQAKKARTDTPASESAPRGSGASGMPSDPPQQTQNVIQQKKPSASSTGTSDLFKSMLSTPKTTAKDITAQKFASGAPQSAPAARTNSLSNLNPARGAQNQAFSNIFSASSSASTQDASGFDVFQPQTAASTTPTKSPPKKPLFEVPKFGGGSGSNFMDAFAKKLQEDEKKKRKAEDFDSDEDNEEEWERKYEEEQRAKRNKFKSVAKGGFVPSFGITATDESTTLASKPTAASIFGAPSATRQPDNDLTPSGSIFGAPASAIAQTSQVPLFAPERKSDPAIENSAAEPISLSDEDESHSNQSGRSFDEGSGPGEDGEDEDEHDEDFQPNDEEEDEEDESEEEQEDDDQGDGSNGNDDDEEDSGDSGNDLQAAMNKSHGKSLFERISRPASAVNEQSDKPNGTASAGSSMKQPAPNHSFKPFTPFGGGEAKSTPQAPTTVSPLTPATTVKKARPAATFEFTPKPSVVTPTPAAANASIFEGGKIKTSGPILGEGLFGSRPSTPNNGGSATPNVFGHLGKTATFSAAGDHTWKQGSPVVFDTPEKDKDAPSLNITTATPPPKDDSSSKPAFGSLFGGSSNPASKPLASAAGQVGFGFGLSSTPTLPGFLGAAGHLAPSVNSSAFSSRATSPGITDNESVATNDTEDVQNDPQTSLMSSRPGEEGEEVLFEARSKAMKYYDKAAAAKFKKDSNTFNMMGLGIVRVLKNEETGKARIVFRAEPGSNVLLNCHLAAAIDYKSDLEGRGGVVRFGVPTGGGIEQWLLKVKTRDQANQLADILMENRPAA